MIDAQAILDSRTTSSSWKGYIPTFLGNGWWPLRHDPGEVHLHDLAHGMAHTYRYGGQADPGITVAEHSVFVSLLVELLWPDKPHLKRPALFHDGVESYLHDIQSPVRRSLHVTLEDGTVLGWEENDDRLIKIIGTQLHIDPELFDAPEVRAADLLAVCFEKRDCKNLVGDWGLPEIPEPVQHLVTKFQMPPNARASFLFRAGELII